MSAERITSSTHTNKAAMITNRPSAATTNEVCPENALASVRTLRTSFALLPPPRSTVRYGPPVPLNQSLLRSTLVVSSSRVSTRPTNHATASVIQPTMPWTTWSQTNPPPALTAPPTVLSNTQPSPSPSQPITGLAGRQRNH